MRHLQGLVVVDQRPGSNIINFKQAQSQITNREGEKTMMLKEFQEDFKNFMHTRRIYAMRFSKTYFSLRICDSYHGKNIGHHNRHQDRR